jgi:serine/threonine protein kinase
MVNPAEQPERTIGFVPADLDESLVVNSAGSSSFRKLRFHAQGGLGQVSIAWDDKLHRRVALKEIRDDHSNNSIVRQRFLTEAIITGQLQHPGIVPVYALEEDASGQPSYAMRFIEGRTLSDAVRDYHARPSPLAFRELLQHFTDICQTISYAHSKNVIHRDLKPANIMLGDYGETLVLDWGLAKQLGTPPSASGSSVTTNFEPDVEANSTRSAGMESTLGGGGSTIHGDPLTQAGDVFGTPPYMAPEQAEGRVNAIGPLADVYALGAILYHLLTGENPYSETDKAAILAQVRRGSPRAPRTIRPDVPKALEAICLKAMAREPHDRYASAADLSQDVQSWLADLPVTAFPDPWTARAGRWLRRHRTLVATTIALLLTTVIALSLGTVLLAEANSQTRDQRNRAQSEAAISKEFNRFFLDDLLWQADPEQNAVSKEITVRQLLDKAAKKVETNPALTEQPQVESAIRFTLGKTYRQLGFASDAEPHLRRALKLQTDLLGEDAEEIQETRDYLAMVLKDQGKYDEAEGLYQKNLTFLQFSYNADHPKVLYALNNLAEIQCSTGKLAEAETIFRDIVAARRRTAISDEANLFLGTLNNLADTLRAQGKTKEAEPLLQECLEECRKQFGPSHPNTLVAANNLAIVYQNLGRLESAESLYRESVESHRKVEGDEHFNTLAAQHNLASLFRDCEREDEAEKLLRQVQEVCGRSKSLEPWFPQQVNISLASVHSLQGRHAEAEALIRKTLTACQGSLGKEHLQTLNAQLVLSQVLIREGKASEADPFARAAVDGLTKAVGDKHNLTLAAKLALAQALFAKSRSADAQPLLAEVVHSPKGLSENYAGLPHPALLLAKLYIDGGQREKGNSILSELEPRLQSRYESLAKKTGAQARRRSETILRLITLYQLWGKPDQEQLWRGRQTPPRTFPLF